MKSKFIQSVRNFWRGFAGRAINVFLSLLGRAVAADKYYQLESNYKKLWDRCVEQTERVNRYEGQGTMDVREQLQLRFQEINGTLPVLWITTSDQKMLTNRAFASIQQIVKSMAPKVELVFLTPDVTLHEMDDTDLAKVGLIRLDKLTKPEEQKGGT